LGLLRVFFGVPSALEPRCHNEQHNNQYACANANVRRVHPRLVVWSLDYQGRQVPLRVLSWHCASTTSPHGPDIRSRVGLLIWKPRRNGPWLFVCITPVHCPVQTPLGFFLRTLDLPRGRHALLACADPGTGARLGVVIRGGKLPVGFTRTWPGEERDGRLQARAAGGPHAVVGRQGHLREAQPVHEEGVLFSGRVRPLQALHRSP
jgi:hypothetical protein